MIEIFILLAKYLFIAYIGVFLIYGLIINLAREDIIEYKIAVGLMKQRLCIILFHVTASIILISVNAEENLNQVVGYCVISLGLLMFGNNLVKRLYPESSHLLYNCIFFLVDIGLIILYRLDSSLAIKQLIWNIAGFVFLTIIPFILQRMPRLDKYKKLYIIVSFVMLIFTLVFGSVSGGSKNWISIGSFGFQPSEIVKLLYVFYLASALSKRPDFHDVIAPTVISGLVVIFLVVQKDLGSALIFVMTYLIVLFIATSNYLYLISGIGAVSLASVIAYKLFSHIQVRVEAWQNSWSDVAGKGYQIAQSLFAICTWGITGIGLTRGYATSIPVVERDFIFAAICEEFGSIFAIGLLAIFILILLEGARGALENRSRFLTLLCAGFTALLAFQTFLIIGGVTKFIPLTGVTLPFISYGGTSIVISYIIIGIIQWIISRNGEYSHDKEIREVDTRERQQQVRKPRRKVARR